MPRFAPAAFAACALAALPCPRARADEQMLPLAASGDWVAVEHSDSETSAPDVCLAMTVPGSGKGLAFRAATSDIEVRLNDESWSLPAQVTGSLVFDVGTYHAVIDITDNTNTMVAAVITSDQLLALIAAMNKAESMTVSAGKAEPTLVSLSGSKTVTTAFLTCAGIRAPGEGGGTNPFQ
jgi:hypothetical protein